MANLTYRELLAKEMAYLISEMEYTRGDNLAALVDTLNTVCREWRAVECSRTGGYTEIVADFELPIEINPES
ncbi:MAG TPA: hypothetical protein VEI97_09030 [bacterium]|nr:hypothetical protein [bacterium]